MKRISIFLVLLVIGFIVNIEIAKSQSPSFTLGLVMPDPSNEFNLEQIQKLESKITQIINNSNSVFIGYSNDIVVYPILSVEETQVVEGGMENLTVSKVEFSLFIKQISSNLVFNSFSKTLSGSGKTKFLSITNAINQIKTQDNNYQKFILESKDIILKYYTDNCESIIKHAETLSSKQEYEKSISLLQSIPEILSVCYTKAQSKSLEVYKKYQSVLCVQNITKAKAFIATNNYESAIEVLEIIDPTSSCYPEVKKLIDQIASRIDKREKQEFDLEVQRISSIKEIGKAYYSNTIRTIKYNVLVN